MFSCAFKFSPLPEVTGTETMVRVCQPCYEIIANEVMIKQAEDELERQRLENVSSRIVLVYARILIGK